jgi:hypothetical protein
MFPTHTVNEVIGWFKQHANIDLLSIQRFDDTREKIFREPLHLITGTPEPHLIRLSPGTPEENDYFLAKLEVFLQSE